MESILTDGLDSGSVKGNYVELSSLVFERPFLNETKSRSSRPEVICKKGVLKNFVKLTGKNLCQRLFLNLSQVFFCEFCEIFKNTYFVEHLWWQLLQTEIL